MSDTGVMPRIPHMTTSAYGLSEAVTAAAASSTTAAQDHLQPQTNIQAVSLSSNSSLNSSSVKTIASKSNGGTSNEKKKKSLSSSRQKKFHRRFKQVEMDEEVINCMYIK